MRWFLLDVALALVCLALLAAVALGLWRRIKALGSAVRVATDQFDTVSRQLDTVGGPRPFAPATPGRHGAQAPLRASGVR